MATTVILLLVLAVVVSTVSLIVRGIASGKSAEAETLRLRGERRSAGPVEGLVIRALAPVDRAAWTHLWDSYCSFYGQELPRQTTDTTWTRMMDPSVPMNAWGAFDPSGNLIGIAHTVLHPHTWSPRTLCYLEDLFVAPPYRGRDVGHALITFLWRKAEAEGWGRLYWHTETTNTSARRLYDRFRPADNYVRYTLTLGILMLVPLLGLSALSPGEDLAAYWKTNGLKYTATRVLGPLKGWSGYETAVLATDSNFAQPPFLLVVRKLSGAVVVPVGTVEGRDHLVLDSDGDGILDVATAKSLVPGWVGLKIPGTRGAGKAFRALADRLYRQYNQTGGPVPAQLNLLVDDLRKLAVDPLDPDRDLSAALLFSLEEGATESAVGVGTLAALGVALQSRGGPVPLVFLFLGEALETAGMNEEAQASYARMRELDPKSLIGEYKQARIDPAALKAFRKAHPDFWASRD